MKYIEELKAGDTFLYDSIIYLLSIDFKKNNTRLCFSMIDGVPRWFSPDCIVKEIKLYNLDDSNNIVPIKEHKNEYNI